MNVEWLVGTVMLVDETDDSREADGDDRPETPRVTVPTDVADVLDGMLSPIDAGEAIDEIVLGLPASHRPSVLARLFRRFGLVRVCVGRVAWCGVELSYVETDGRLLVLDAWETGSRPSGRVTCELNGLESVASV